MAEEKRIAAVTGAGQGLGRGVALRLADAGYRIALLDRQSCDETAKLLADKGVDSWQHVTDVSDESSVVTVFSAMENEFGVPSALVNAAGIFADHPVHETSVDTWDRIMAVNARGPFLMCREGSRRMKENGGGSIVNILSNAAVQGFANESAYCASKGAALLLTRTLAVELAGHNITVNGVGPGTSETAMGGDYLGEGPIAAHELSRTPLGRWGQPADIAEAVAFFCNQATWVTGQALYVDGGFLATGLPTLKGM
ncbi:SDR family NAD(P)-dependent oxidoreductase [Arthrobacter castelli]|uniref:SDR family NAD(P)-dependent oxidoreductase n=1 Tax=Arthrobacter castelli TaxID=271431 RepID=UPI000427AADA|nr:SDR family NAD(P)-dependent oxidoreductase [Arthrobacter castelli]